MSVPALSGPFGQQSPGTPQKTITALLSQWEALIDEAIAATGVTDGWYRGAIIERKPWDPAAEDVALSPCLTVGSKDSHQLIADVSHDPFDDDPHPIADKLTAHWESQGFIVKRTMDWTNPTGDPIIEIIANRADGVQYGLTATNLIVAIDIATECSTHPSLHEWSSEKSLRIGRERREAATPTPSSPPASPAADDDHDPDGWNW